MEVMVAADNTMRTKWVEMVRSDSVSLTQAVKQCRTEWASLFTDLHSSGDASSTSSRPQAVSEAPSKIAKKELSRVTEDRNGAELCPFYNKGKCTYGKRCRFKHACNVAGCGKEHAAVDTHQGA